MTGKTRLDLYGRTMKAIVRERYGSAEVLGVSDVEVPRPGDGEVLLRVRAAGLDRGAWHVMAGMPYAMRLAGFGVRRPKNPGLGSDVAGVVEQLGSGVRGLSPGDAVYGTCGPASSAAAFASSAFRSGESGGRPAAFAAASRARVIACVPTHTSQPSLRTCTVQFIGSIAACARNGTW